jgi:hypothetical protein
MTHPQSILFFGKRYLDVLSQLVRYSTDTLSRNSQQVTGRGDKWEIYFC